MLFSTKVERTDILGACFAVVISYEICHLLSGEGLKEFESEYLAKKFDCSTCRATHFGLSEKLTGSVAIEPCN